MSSQYASWNQLGSPPMLNYASLDFDLPAELETLDTQDHVTAW